MLLMNGYLEDQVPTNLRKLMMILQSQK